MQRYQTRIEQLNRDLRFFRNFFEMQTISLKHRRRRSLDNLLAHECPCKKSKGEMAKYLENVNASLKERQTPATRALEDDRDNN